MALLFLATAARAADVDVAGMVRLARLADVDGDGVREVVILAAQEGFDPNGPDVTARRDRVLVFHASGGSLVPAPPRPLPGLASAFSVLDVTGDSTPELLAVTQDGLVREDGTVVLAGASFLHEDRSDLALDLAIDVDGEGHLDLALPTASGMRYVPWAAGVALPERPGMDLPLKAVSLGSEAPSPLQRLAGEAGPPRADFVRFLPLVRDLDADGRLDAVMPSAGKIGRLEGLAVHFGAAEGKPFDAAGRTIELSLRPGEVLTGADALAFGDLDGDGILEVGVLSYDLDDFGFTQTHRLRVFGFDPGYVPRPSPLLDVETSANIWEPSRVSMADATGDGRADLLVTHIGGLRKVAFTAEHYVRKDDGGFVRREETFKTSRDDDIDRSALLRPSDLDGDGKADFVVVGKRVVYVLSGVLDGRTVFREPPREIRPAGADSIVDVLVDDAAAGADPIYVVSRTAKGKHRLLRQELGSGR